MRVQDKGPTTGISGSGTIRRTTGAGGQFSLAQADGTARAASLQGAAPVGAMDGLLALQAQGDALERRKRGMRRGKGLLDGLDQLKIALLSGSVSPAQLENLRNQMHQRRETVDDAGLDEILAHIELRAEVELAKLAKR